MKKDEIKVGGHYVAKVSGKLTTVRVDAIRETSAANYSWRTNNGFRYDVTNLKTGRKTTFKSAAKFRWVAKPGIATEMAERHAQAAEGRTDETDEAARQAEEDAASR